MAELPDRKTILVVDDEVGVREVLSDRLQAEGFGTLTAEDGAKGLALALEKHPDLILLDIIMPNTDGFTMLEQLRMDTWGKTANVMLLTNLSDTESVSKAIEFQGNEFLVKSDWDIADVVERVKQKLASG